MKKYYLLATLCGLLGLLPAHAQSPGADSLRQKLDVIFANINKSQVPTGYLYEYGVRLLPFRYFTGALSDSNRTNMDVLRYLRLSMSTARIYGTDTLPSVKVFNARLRAAAPDVAGAPIPLAVQYMAYASIKPDAFQNNLLSLQNEQVFDVPGRPQSPYQTQVLFAAAPEYSFSPTNTVSFVFRRNLHLASGSGSVAGLFLDFGDGRGYQSATWDQPLATTYATAGIKRLRVKLQYATGGELPPNNGTIRGTQSQSSLTAYEIRESHFDFEVLSVVAAARYGSTYQIQSFPNNVGAGNGLHSGGTAYVRLGAGHTRITKPLYYLGRLQYCDSGSGIDSVR